MRLFPCVQNMGGRFQRRKFSLWSANDARCKIILALSLRPSLSLPFPRHISRKEGGQISPGLSPVGGRPGLPRRRKGRKELFIIFPSNYHLLASLVLARERREMEGGKVSSLLPLWREARSLREIQKISKPARRKSKMEYARTFFLFSAAVSPPA